MITLQHSLSTQRLGISTRQTARGTLIMPSKTYNCRGSCAATNKGFCFHHSHGSDQLPITRAPHNTPGGFQGLCWVDSQPWGLYASQCGCLHCVADDTTGSMSSRRCPPVGAPMVASARMCSFWCSFWYLLFFDVFGGLRNVDQHSCYYYHRHKRWSIGNILIILLLYVVVHAGACCLL